MSTDFTKPPKEILVDLINSSCGTAFTPEQLTFSDATPSDPSAPRNTKIVATGAEGSGLRGEVVLYYDRKPLADVVAEASSTIFETGDASLVSDLLPAINARLGIGLPPEDIVDGVLPQAETLTFNLALRNGAGVFTGVSPLQLTAFAAAGYDLRLLGDIVLPGFTYPA